MNITGIVLSGGKSSRMGTDKGLIKYHGKTLVERAIEIIEPVVDKIIISANNKDYEKFGYPVIADEIIEIGPIGGLFSVIKKNKSDKYFIIACDIPNVNRSLAQKMLNRSSNCEIMVPQLSDGKIEPLFGVYSYSVFTKIKIQIELANFKMLDLLTICKTKYLPITQEYININSNPFKNFNTPEDVNPK